MKKSIVFILICLGMNSCKDANPSSETNPEVLQTTTEISQNDARLNEINLLIINNPNSEKGYYELAKYQLENNCTQRCRDKLCESNVLFKTEQN